MVNNFSFFLKKCYDKVCDFHFIFSAIKLQAILNRIEMTLGSASCCLAGLLEDDYD